MKNVAIIGLGYVGLPLAIAISQAGHRATGIEKDLLKISRLNKSDSYIEDVSNTELNDAINSGALTFSSDLAEVSNSQIIIICVPTPLDEQRDPDLTALNVAVKSVVPYLSKGSLLISESTSYPGTIRELIIPLIEQIHGSEHGILVASAPERVDPGNNFFGYRNTPRVVGGMNKEASKQVADFYRTFCSEVFEVSSPEVAETAKLLENTFRQVNIALINEISTFTRKMGIEIREVIEAASTKPYGFMPFYPGAGVGGHCIPIDPTYLAWKADREGISLSFIELANKINIEQPLRVIERFQSITQNQPVKSVVISGIGYKYGISDTRETPAEEIYAQLISLGYEVFWHDEFVPEWNFRARWEFQEADALIVLNKPSDNLAAMYLKEFTIILDCSGYYLKNSNVFQL